ncbi:MAG TPA: sulfite exporter TauE/SafE family protein [Candidatus Limnocylindria bacterium]|nr:sulfite exporter TauE/SafE family protein [Candidatus Limnocylindria bacterium]
MNPLEIAAIAAAAVGAGALNTVVGSGSLLTFPVLLAFGIPPVSANVTNAIGLVPGTLSGTVGYRDELEGQGRRIALLAGAAVLGGLCGSVLLLVLPPESFRMIVPYLILLAVALVIVQPWLARVMEERRREGESHRPLLVVGVFLVAIYGGYFGGAQSVLMIGLLGVLLKDDLQRLNALKNLLSVLTNATAAILFAFVAPVEWLAVVVIAIGSVAGGQLGAAIGQRLPEVVLRGAVAAVGLVAAALLFLS